MISVNNISDIEGATPKVFQNREEFDNAYPGIDNINLTVPSKYPVLVLECELYFDVGSNLMAQSFVFLYDFEYD